jgi:hypothetical protein
MRLRTQLTLSAFAVLLGAAVLPALAQEPRGTMGGGMMSQGMDGQGMKGQGMKGQGMMAGGCAGMMQSMNGGDARPNSQWQSHRPDAGTPD